MLTNDFSGIYDYELEEALHAAETINNDFIDGYYRNDLELNNAIDKERAHWAKVLEPDGFQCFNGHFTIELKRYKLIK